MSDRCTLVLVLTLLFALESEASGLPQGTRFGEALSTADVNGDGFDDVIVGEPGHDGFALDAGRVLVYHGSAAGPASAPSWSRTGLQAGALFGAAVAGVGDVDGDGFEDVAVGAPGFDGPPRRDTGGPGAARSIRPLRDTGALIVFRGSPAGLASVPMRVRPGIQLDERLGITLARAGDVNGDGFDDVLVGASGTDGGLGAAFVFDGSPDGTRDLPSWIARGDAPDTGFGTALGGGGDVNGDGFDDVVVGVPDGGTSGRGTAFAWLGSAAGLPAAPSWTLGTPASGDGPLDNGNSDWGAAVAIGGDLNGDGFDDVLVGNPTYDGDTGHGSGQQLDTGVVFVHRGASTGIGTRAARMTGSGGGRRIGTRVSGIGDRDGDGRPDTALAGGHSDTAFVRYGHGTYWQGLSLVLAVWGEPNLGAALSGGDVDGDGLGEMLASDPDLPGGAQVFICRGIATLSPPDLLVPDWTLSAP